MGCFTSKSASEDDLAKAKATLEIDNQLKQDMIEMRKEVKMLLLGTGESGKSTILKQMQLIHGDGFSDSERLHMREIVMKNMLQSIMSIIEGASKLNIAFENQAVISACTEKIPERLKSGDSGIDTEILALIKSVIDDSGAKAALARANEFQLNDSAVYFFEHIDRLSELNYTPTYQDILRTRVKTTGVVENTFFIDNLTFRLFDVGGQRSERKKWIHCFENVTAIIYMASLSEYDQRLFEDESQNRLNESLQLFSSICNSRWFTKTNLILFLNKIDLFRAKITVSPISNYFPEYQGGPHYDPACLFFRNKFRALNQSTTKEVYVHFTCATDTTQIRFIFKAVRNIIMKNNLYDAGLMS